MSNVKYVQLGDVADVLAGYAFRCALDFDKSGNMAVFQAKDVRKGLYVDDTQLAKIDMHYSGDRLLHSGDVLLSGRGFFEASVFISHAHVIAVSSVYIVRLHTAKILPEFLAIYFNSTSGQNQLRRYETSTTLKAILPNDVKKIRIPLPCIEKQRIMIDLYALKSKHKKLLQRKEELHHHIFEHAIKTITTHV